MPNEDSHALNPLWDHSRNGDAMAWNTLLEKLRAYLKALVRSWLGADLTRQLGDSDIAQEALLKIEKGRATLRAGTLPEFLGWAKRIAHRTALDALERWGKAAHVRQLRGLQSLNCCWSKTYSWFLESPCST